MGLTLCSDNEPKLRKMSYNPLSVETGADKKTGIRNVGEQPRTSGLLWTASKKRGSGLDRPPDSIVSYAPLSNADTNSAFDLSSRIMSEAEPLIRFLMGEISAYRPGKSAQVLKEELFETLKDKFVNTGLSHVAKIGYKVVGVRLVLNWEDCPGCPPLPCELDLWKRIWTKAVAEWKVEDKDKWAHCVLAVVDPAYAGRSIEEKLFQLNLNALRRAGKVGCIASTWSYPTYSRAKKAGYEEITSVTYHEYKDEEKKDILDVDALRGPNLKKQQVHQFTLWEISTNLLGGDTKKEAGTQGSRTSRRITDTQVLASNPILHAKKGPPPPPPTVSATAGGQQRAVKFATVEGEPDHPDYQPGRRVEVASKSNPRAEPIDSIMSIP